MSGPKLFQQLQRFVSSADVEDYYKHGTWQDELMRTDMQLVEAHRREGGAPDPLSLEEVPVVKLPGASTPQKTTAFAPVARLGLGVTTATQARSVTGTPSTVSSSLVAAQASGSTGPVAELRLIALFIAKWKLDPTKTKMLFAKLTPVRRRFVIQNFKNSAAEPSPTAALERYIQEMDQKGAEQPSAATENLPKQTMAGVKRPLAITPAAGVLDAKRPRIGITAPLATTGASPAMATAARLAAARLRMPAAPVRMATARSSMLASTLAARPGLATVRPAPAVRPNGSITLARPMVPKARAEEKPGGLIKSLLHRP